MNRKRKDPATTLNENDRKVLDKYARYYTNFIESNTATTEYPGGKLHKSEP